MRTKRPLAAILLFGMMASFLPAQTTEQFSIRLANEEFSRFCPATEIPPIQAQIGSSVTFEVSILAQQPINLQTAVVLPSGSSTSLVDLGALMDPELPAVLASQEEALSTVEWTTTAAPPGLYVFQFVAASGTAGGSGFTTCEVQVQLNAEDGSCVLSSAVDGMDGDTQIDFGDVTVGRSETGVALLGFSIPVSEAVGDNQIFACLPNTPSLTLFPGTIVEESLLIPLEYAPSEPGELNDQIVFYHGSDVGGEDLCKLETLPENPCIRHIDLRGRGVASTLSVSFENGVCGVTPQIDVVLRNESTEELQGLSAVVESPLGLSPLGDFSVSDFSLGPAESPDGERRFRIQFTSDPGEQVSRFFIVSGSGTTLLQTEVPAPPCLSVFPLSLEFGETAINAPALLSVRLSNGLSEAVSVDVSITPGDQDFSVDQSTVTIDPGAFADLQVQFLPADLGPKNATLEFASGLEVEIPPVPLSGEGVANPNSSLSFQSDGVLLPPGATLTFPETSVSSSSSRVLTVTNEGLAPAISVGAFSASGEFEVSPAGVADLDPGASRDYTVTFRPEQTGHRSGTLTVSGSDIGEVVFPLEGEGLLGDFALTATGLEATVPPRQINPYPAVGLQLPVPSPVALAGTLQIEFDSAGLPADPSVRFLDTGGSIPFRIEGGSTQAFFSSEPDQRKARFQSGTVAGLIHFSVSDLATTDGEAVTISGGPQVGAVEVPRQAPVIFESPVCTRTGGGIELALKAFSTTREISGVDLNLTAAPNADLSFTKPPEDFVNALFSSWFSNPDRNQYGGAFTFNLPIAISDIRAFGSLSIRMRNAVGWSALTTVDAAACH